ncbi:nucleobase-ascorbate transporter 6-like [Vicia villosa]|uniref:nucleobase-ascorbate transporter 6-like n=1 Tax=Vicia villosa TaxID=3911 RepID=UPI00273B38F8|nr:nucleobase-ascorbate transporter 6-like [Vicia villosa]XP_058739900.1 nucleobase-ascorbate transporter 6-like [Vicia villosa]XP_058739901.1 nucleobase-ascorbate transporter 6-like [Vicia villosa]XP_058739902.1 nucleobase-ascorbate transporter 6-like [Vicia villosa]XP_058739903.1 nucleobase-ascorbate transporter 6-like [Vicia villosa]XP_058739904.1 nucleobase-ascorbate transporter 6-like [Vicia villosa]XP_058739906.1 nucleobase-ascorbate transporter 6-like [Vicia villosa]
MKFVLGFSIFLGLSIPQYFNEYTTINGFGPFHTGARWFHDMVNVPFQSKAFVAGVVAYFLDNTLHKKESAIRKDRGKHWWDKYRSFKTDTRSLTNSIIQIFPFSDDKCDLYDYNQILVGQNKFEKLYRQSWEAGDQSNFTDPVNRWLSSCGYKLWYEIRILFGGSDDN